jgi:hypothetical protein
MRRANVNSLKTKIKWAFTAIATLLAFGLLASCTPPLPPDAQAAAAERIIICIDGEQAIDTPEFLIAGLEVVNATLSGQCPEQSILFTTDPDASVKILDRAPTDQEIAEFEKQCNSEVVVAPVFGVAADVAYNQPGLDNVFFTPELLADILLGKVTSWDDPRIAELNDGYEFDGTPITLLRLNGPSGSVQAMTKWLSEAAPSSWPLGEVDVLPEGKGFDTIQELMDEMTIEFGTVTIAPIFEAQIFSLQLGALPAGESIIEPVDTDFPKIGIAAAVISFDEKGHMRTTHATGGVPVEGQFDAAAAKIVIQPDQEIVGWPAVAVAHIMACDDPTEPLAKSTAQYLVRLTAQGTIEGTGLTSLPEPIRFRTFPALKVELPDDLTAIDLELEEEVVENEPGLGGGEE